MFYSCSWWHYIQLSTYLCHLDIYKLDLSAFHPMFNNIFHRKRKHSQLLMHGSSWHHCTLQQRYHTTISLGWFKIRLHTMNKNCLGAPALFTYWRDFWRKEKREEEVETDALKNVFTNSDICLLRMMNTCAHCFPNIKANTGCFYLNNGKLTI